MENELKGVHPIVVSFETSELDALYGPCLEAGKNVNPHEQQFAPTSRQKLSQETASLLIKYFEFTSKSGLLVPGAMHRGNPILWVMDREGEIWFAVEEVFDIYEGNFQFALGRGAEPPRGTVKLGHPALLPSTTDKAARIGGEITYMPLAGQWRISNRSGRYGTRPYQTENHLTAVRDRFAEFGVELSVSQWPRAKT